MSCRAVLFDLGYTLLDYPLEGTWGAFLRQRLEEMYASVREAVGNISLSPTEFAARAAGVIGGEGARALEHSGHSWHFARRLRAALAALGMSCDDDGLERLTDVFLDPIRVRARPYPDTSQSLDQLRALGMMLAIISNSPWDTPGGLGRNDLGKWGLDGYFEAMIFSGDVPWRKPNPEFMLAAARELGVEPAECLVVGDTLEADIAGARAAGMRSVWINRKGLSLQAAQGGPEWTVRRLAEVRRIVAGGAV